jgi:hypothetical protein
MDLLDAHSYELFSLLTGLDFSPRKLRPLVPVAPLRGWPTDLSNAAFERLMAWSDDTAFGRSWLDASELAAYDWDTAMTWTFMASPPKGIAITKETKSKLHAYWDEHHRLPPCWHAAGQSRDGFDVSLPTTPRDHAWGLIKVVDEMTEMAGDDTHAVRCVFEFTR